MEVFIWLCWFYTMHAIYIHSRTLEGVSCVVRNRVLYYSRIQDQIRLGNSVYVTIPYPLPPWVDHIGPSLVGWLVVWSTFNNISVISWRSVYWWRNRSPEKTTDLPQVNDKLYPIMLYSSPWAGVEPRTSVVIGTDYIGSCKSNYHTITATTAPSLTCNKFLWQVWQLQPSLLIVDHICDKSY